MIESRGSPVERRTVRQPWYSALHRALGSVMIVSTALLPTGGCGSAESDEEMSRANLKRLVELRKQYAASHGNQGPKSADELRAWIEGMDAGEREAANLTDAASLFVSPRDGEPYTFIDPGAIAKGHQGDHIAVFEQFGVLGSCLVAFDSGRIELMDINERAEILEEYLEH